MKSARKFITYPAVVIISIWITAATLPPAWADAPPKTGIQWTPYQEGVALGKQNGKKIFLNFYADWCRYCAMMNKTTFEDKSVISYLNDNFISIKVNTDKDQKIAMKYNINQLPDNWFVAQNGEQIGNMLGYLPPEQLLPLLKFIHTDSYKKMSLKEFIGGP